MSPVTASTIGSFIREQREQAKISMRQLAQAAGVSNPYLSQVERGLRRPSADILQQIAKGLRISAEALYVQAGILDDRPGGSTVPDAIRTDPELTERQKQMLIEIYDSFRKEVRADAEARADAEVRTAAMAELPPLPDQAAAGPAMTAEPIAAQPIAAQPIAAETVAAEPTAAGPVAAGPAAAEPAAWFAATGPEATGPEATGPEAADTVAGQHAVVEAEVAGAATGGWPAAAGQVPAGTPSR